MLFYLTTLLALAVTASADDSFSLEPKGRLNAYDAAMQIHGRVQQRRGQEVDDMCGAAITEYTICLITSCTSVECEGDPGQDDELNFDEGFDCTVLKAAICNSFDYTCCPACQAEEAVYADCVLSLSLGYLCPDAGSCSDGIVDGGEGLWWTNETIPDGNMTNSSIWMGDYNETGELIGDSTAEEDDFLGFMDGGDNDEDVSNGNNQFSCLDETTGAIDTCIALNGCLENGCVVEEPDDADADTTMATICSEGVPQVCSSLQKAEECCPACKDEIDAFLACYVDSFVSLFCPDITPCTSVATSKSGSEAKKGHYLR